MDRNTLMPSVIVSTRRADDPPPSISVAVSTYQRASMLPRLIAALERQTLPFGEFEVVLADNGSSPETAEVIEKLAASTELRLHAVRVAANRGPSGGRNIAWHETRADVVAFTDDDCAPAEGWLEHGLRAMRAGNAVVVGRTLPDPNLEMGPFSRTIRVGDVNWLPTCNVFYRRSDLEAVDGFDESFMTPGGEDTDLAFRVRTRCSREFRYASEALVHHDVRPSRFIDAAKETFRWTDAPRFFRLHPEGRGRLHRRIFWKPSHPKVMLAVAGLVLGSRSRAWLALTLPWLHYRTRVRKPPGGGLVTYTSLPGTFVVDALETVAIVRGAVRHRTFIL